MAPQYKKAWNVSLPEKLNSVLLEAKAKHSDKEKIELVAKKINEMIAYSGNWTTKAGKMFPTGVDLSIKRGKGDCKDFSTVMISLLTKMGFEAYPFLTFRSQEYMGEGKLTKMSTVPSPSFFNHVIVWAKGKDGKVWWVDPTNPHVIADVITGDILGNFGLLLDDKSNTAQFLPKANAVTADFTMDNTITINADNSVSGSGSVVMSPSVYSSVMLAEKSGAQAGGKIIGYIINPMSRTIKVDYKKSKTKDFTLDYSFHANDFVEEQMGKFKAIVAFNPVGLYLERIKRDKNADLGEVGTTKITTHIKKQKELDTIRAGCLIRSKWLDEDRYVENKPDEIMVTDIVKAKSRFINKKESHGDGFDNFLGDISQCTQNSALILSLNDSLKTAQALEDDKIKGAPFEKMTDADAEVLFEMKGPKLLGYRNLKVFRYYQKKSEANKADYLAFSRMASTISEMGYLSGDTYTPEYLEEGFKYFDKSIGDVNKIKDPKFAAEKIKYLIYANKVKEASELFSSLKKQYPKNVETFRSAHRILAKQKRFGLAEKWLLATKSLNKSEEDQYIFHKLMEKFYYSQEKWAQAIPHQEYIANKSNDAWSWHNLAVLYYQMKNYDKNIELEKKALTISEFGMAKRVIADSYLQKAIAIGTKDVVIRAPASEPKFENFLLESVKYDGMNAQANAMLAKYYIQNYQKNKDQALLSKAKQYFQQAVKANPNFDDLDLISILIEGAEKFANKQQKES